jgi:hypothetical protein
MASFFQTVHTSSFKPARLTIDSMSQQRLKATSWASLLQHEIKATEKKPQGKGWKTAKELQHEFKVGERKLYDILAKLSREKRIERFSGFIINDSGQKATRAWYRVKRSA